MALIGKNKLKFVLGEYAKPNSTSPFVDKWNRCNKMILDWIMHATIKNISDNIMFSSTPRDAWIELKQSYGQADGTRMFEIQRDLCSISQNVLSVAEYFTKIKNFWNECTLTIIIPHCKRGMDCASLAAVHKMIENQQLQQFLVSVNEQYKIFRGNLIMMKPLPTLNQAYNVIFQDKKQRHLNNISHIVNQYVEFNAQAQYTTKSDSVAGPEHVVLADSKGTKVSPVLEGQVIVLQSLQNVQKYHSEVS